MSKTIFEEMGGTYTEINGYIIPNLVFPPEEENKPIGIWGHHHLRYIKQHKRIFYTNMLTSCKLNSYLADIDEQAENIFSRLVKEMAKNQGVTEQLKAADPMAWVGKMNNIRNSAMEIVNIDLIYS